MNGSSTRRFLLVLIGAMAAVAVAVGTVALALLYRAANQEALRDAQRAAVTLASMAEAVARFDARFSREVQAEGAWGAAMSRLTQGVLLQRLQSNREEVVIGRRVGKELQVLSIDAQAGLREASQLPLHGSLAMGLDRALDGESGSAVLRDFKGAEALVGYAPVKTLDIGIAYAIALQPVRAPFVAAALWIAAITGVLIALGAAAFTRLARPLLQQVEHNEHRLAALMATIPVGVYETDPAGSCVFVNDTWCEQAGLARAQAMGAGWVKALHADDAHRVQGAWQRLVGQGEPFALEFRFRRPDGSDRPVFGQARGVVDDGGVVLGYTGTVTDISELVAARRAHEQAAARLEEAQAIAQMGSWELDLVGNVLSWSKEVFRIFEMDAARFGASYEAFLAAIHPDDRELVDRAFKASLAERTPYRVKHRLRLPDGRIKWVEDRCETTYDAAGRPVRSLGTVQDITRQVEAEQQTQRVRALMSQLIDASPDWIFVKDLEHRFVLVNLSFARAMALQPEQMIGRPDTDFWPLEQCEGDPERGIRGSHQDDRRAFAGEVSHNPSDPATVAGGAVRVFDTLKGPLRDEAGRIVGVFAYSRDVTERVDSDRALKDSEARYRQLFETMSVGVVYQASDGRIEDANPAAQRILGLSLAEMQGRTSRDPRWRAVREDGSDFPGEEHPAMVALRTHRPVHDVVMGVFHPQDQTYRWIQVDATPEFRRGEPAPYRVYATFDDITDRRHFEERIRLINTELEARVGERTAELVAARNAAESASRAKSDFLSRMSHELRTPMNAIMGFAAVLEMDRALDETLRGYVNEILGAGDHLLELINELLDLSRIEVGKLAIMIEPVALRPVVQQALRIVKPLLDGRQIVLHDRCDPHTLLLADASRLRQVLVNLLSNAVKYNRFGGRVEIESRPVEGDRLRVSISDTGQGIEPRKLGLLFKPFERLGAEFGAVDGTGIGLALSKQLVELMGGEVGAQSALGHGSTFWFELPLAPGDAAVAAAGLPLGQEHAAKHLRVLYVEDNAANLRVVEAMFRLRPDLQLLGANHGEYGLELARRLKPDVILLDIHLPGMSGYDVLAALQADPATRDIPVMALSADALPLDVETGLKSGFRRYLTKPVKVAELFEAIEQCLARQERAG